MHGDLYELDGIYIFNAVLEDGYARRFPCNVIELMSSTKRCVQVRSYDLFEKRGVVIFLKVIAQPNEAAAKYIRGD